MEEFLPDGVLNFRQQPRIEKGDPHQAGYAVHSFSLSYKPVSVKGFEASVTLDNAFNKLAMNGKGVPLSGRTVSLYTRYQW